MGLEEAAVANGEGEDGGVREPAPHHSQAAHLKHLIQMTTGEKVFAGSRCWSDLLFIVEAENDGTWSDVMLVGSGILVVLETVVGDPLVEGNDAVSLGVQVRAEGEGSEAMIAERTIEEQLAASPKSTYGGVIDSHDCQVHPFIPIFDIFCVVCIHDCLL